MIKNNTFIRCIVSLLIFSLFITFLLPVSNVYAGKKKKGDSAATQKAVGVLFIAPGDISGKLSFADDDMTVGVCDWPKNSNTKDTDVQALQTSNTYTNFLSMIKKCKKSYIVLAPSYKNTTKEQVQGLTKFMKSMQWTTSNGIDGVYVLGMPYKYASSNTHYSFNMEENTKVKYMNTAISNAVAKAKSGTYVSNSATLDLSDDKFCSAVVSSLGVKESHLKKLSYKAKTEEEKKEEKKKSIQIKDTDALLKQLGVDSKYKTNIEAYAILLTNLGYSNAATAGILGNMRAESGFNPLADEKGKNGGLFGFTPMTNFSNSQYNKNCQHQKGVAGGQSVCSDGTCQIEYMLGVLKSSIDSYSNRLSKADEYFKSVKGKTLNYSASAKAVWSSNYKLPDKIDSVKNLSEFKKSDDPISAASVFLICFERAAGTFVPCDINGKRAVANNVVPGYKYTWQDFAIHEFDTKNGRLSYAEPIYVWLGGSSLGSGADKKSVDKAKQIAEDAAKKGYLSESELSAWTKIVNEKYIGYADVTRDNLSQSDLNSLNQWEDNVAYDNMESHGIFKVFRQVIMFLAILLMVYAVLLYCAFWFDKVNPLFDFSLLYILTFGKLSVAPTDEEVNYTVQNFFQNNEGKSKFVNHKYILVVCISLILFSLLIITGNLYRIITMILGVLSNFFTTLF